MEKEETTEEIVDGLQKKHSNKLRALIIMFSAIGIIIFLILLISAFFYFKSPEKTLGLGANIESVLLSADGTISYIKLAGGSLDKNITKIKFIFIDENGNEQVYETSEGIKEIEVAFKRSFWDWLFGRQLKGVYDYEIKAGDIGLNDFNNINEVGVLFEYKTDEGDVIETSVLDTGTTTRTTTTGGGSSGGTSDGGTTIIPCAPESKETTCGNYCGIKKNNCDEDVNCACQSGTYCYTGEGVNNICINESINCSDSDGRDYYNKGNVSINNLGVYLFKEDNCSGNLSEFYCYYNGSWFEARNESYGCSNGCENGKCKLPSCTNDLNCGNLTGECGTGKCNTTINECYINYSVGNVCRALSGACGAAELCSGSSVNCPADANSIGNLCRTSAFECDAAELCLGNNASCPADANKTNGESCAGGSCTNGRCITIICGDGICAAGENCPADVNGCADNSCYEPFCINGCRQTAVPARANDEACLLLNYCNGAGSCVRCINNGDCGTNETCIDGACFDENEAFSFMFIGDDNQGAAASAVGFAYTNYPDIEAIFYIPDLGRDRATDYNAIKTVWQENPNANPSFTPLFMGLGNHDVETIGVPEYTSEVLGPNLTKSLPGMRNFREGLYMTYTEHGNYEDRNLTYSFDYKNAHFIM